MLDLFKSKSESLEEYLHRIHSLGVASDEDLELWHQGNTVNLQTETRTVGVQVSPKTRTIPKVRFQVGVEVVEDETHYFSITELAYSVSSINIHIPDKASKKHPEVWINRKSEPVPDVKFEIELERYIQNLIDSSRQLPNEQLLDYANRLVSLNLADPTVIENWRISDTRIAVSHVLELSALKTHPRKVHRQNGELLEYEIAVPYTRIRRVLLVTLPKLTEPTERQPLVFKEVEF